MLFQNNDVKIVVNKKGINETITRFVVDDITSQQEMITSLTTDKVSFYYKTGKIDFDYQKVYKDAINLVNQNNIKLNNISNSNLSYTMIEYYTLLAMACLYGAMISIFITNKNSANITSAGKRTTISPVHKKTMLLSSFLASYIVQMLGILVIFLYTIFVLKVDYGNNIPLVILLLSLGSLAGLTLGIAIGTLLKASETTKTGILIAITMFFSFLSGMMGITMKYVIDTNVPILNLINPAAMITDGFYSLYYYDTLNRFYFNIISLIVFSIIMLAISYQEKNMTVFNTFWKVINKYKGTIILFTVMLIAFGGINTTTSNTSLDFTNNKPDIVIINNDQNKGLTKNLIAYLKENTNVKDIKDEEEIDDALFYRQVNYIIYIPKNYRNDILSGINHKIDIKTTDDYDSSLAEMILKRYLKTQEVYSKTTSNEQELIEKINTNLKTKSEVSITSTVNTDKTSKVSGYYNFASYSIMYTIIFIICMVLASFNEKTIKKRTIISSMNYKTHNKLILKASFLYSIIVWLLFMILGIILFPDTVISLRGLIYTINAFIFTFASLTLALLISSLSSNKSAITGIANVVCLGSAFLCGAFIPSTWLPDTVIKISRIFPTYWYVNSNDLLSSLEKIDLNSLEPIIINMLVVLLFSLIFIVLTNIISKKKQIVE